MILQCVLSLYMSLWITYTNGHSFYATYMQGHFFLLIKNIIYKFIQRL